MTEAERKKIGEEQMTRVRNAKSILIVEQEFFAVGVLTLEAVINWRIPTAATNGKKVWFNPLFIKTLTMDEVVGLWCHEWFHIMLLHPFRGKGYIHILFNMAGDAVINYILLYENKLKLPVNRIEHRHARGKSTEQMYDIYLKEKEEEEQIPTPPEGNGQGEGEGGGKDDEQEGEQEGEQDGGQGTGGDNGEGDGVAEGEGNRKGNEEKEKEKENDKDEEGLSLEKLFEGAFDEVIPYEGDEEDTPQELESKVKETVQKALMIARSRGTVPGWAEELIKSVYTPVVPWEQIVQAWFGDKAKEDYTWKRPNRRYTEVYLPKLESPCVGHVAFLEDTSGSMNTEEFGQISGQLEYLMDIFKMEMTIVYFDYAVQGILHVDRGDKIDLDKHPGRGGTSFKAPFNKLEELHLIQDLKGIVVLTDGECSSFPEDPGIDVLWILVREYEFSPPFGRVVTFKQ